MNKVNLWILSESLREIFAPSFQSISGLPRIGVVRTWNKTVTHAYRMGRDRHPGTWGCSRGHLLLINSERI